MEFLFIRRIFLISFSVLLTVGFGGIASADINDGLVAYYPFNGNTNDETGNGYDGIIHGDTALCDDRLGNSNSAYYFDGNGDYIKIGQDPDFPSWDTYALSVWFLNDGGGDNTNSYGQKIIDKTVYWHDFYLRVYTFAAGAEPWPGSLSWITYEGGGGGISDTNYDYRDNLWHHAIINKSGSYGELWVDGNLIGTYNDIKTVFSSADLLIGYCLSTDSLQRRYWSGKIDDIRIYDRVLTADEIQLLLGEELECIGFESPMDKDTVKVKKNRALPFKAELTDGNGSPVTDDGIYALPYIHVIRDAGTPDAEDVTDDALPAGQGTDGNEFVYSGGKWQFNLKINNYSSPGTYTVTMESPDEEIYVITPTCMATFVVE